MIKVRSWIYRLVWIACALCSMLLLASPLMLFSDSVTVEDRNLFTFQMVIFGVVGAFALIYSLRRLLYPLKAPPRV